MGAAAREKWVKNALGARWAAAGRCRARAGLGAARSRARVNSARALRRARKQASARAGARGSGRWRARWRARGWALGRWGWAAARVFRSFDIFDLFDPFCPIFPCLLTFFHLFINLFVMYCFKYSSLSLYIAFLGQNS